MAQQAQRGLLLSSRATKAYCVQQTPVSSKFGVYLLSSKGSRCCACWLPEQEVLLCLSTTGPSCGGFFGHIHTLYSCESRHWDTRGQGTAGGALHHHANTHGLEERNLQSPGQRQKWKLCQRRVYVLLELLLRPPFGVGILLPTLGAEVPDFDAAGPFPCCGAAALQRTCVLRWFIVHPLGPIR